VIGIAGTKGDPVMVHFAAHCVAGDVPFAVLDLMETSAAGDWRLSVPPDPADFVSGAETVRLADLTGLYIRPIYLGRTPSHQARWHGLMEGLGAWLDEAGLTVVNRLGAHQLNGYKPAHYAWLSAHGLLVPPSLLSADPERVREFIGGGRAVVKPVCGTRATTREISLADLGRLARSKGPVLVQRMIEGDDVRVPVLKHDHRLPVGPGGHQGGPRYSRRSGQPAGGQDGRAGSGLRGLGFQARPGRQLLVPRMQSDARLQLLRQRLRRRDQRRPDQAALRLIGRG
jgi:hypothetical protein